MEIRVWLEISDALVEDKANVLVQSLFPAGLLVQSLFPEGLAESTYASEDSSLDFWLEAYEELKEHKCVYGGDEPTCGATLCYSTNMWKLKKYQDEYRFIIESVLGLWFDNNEPIENCEIIMEIPGD